MAISTLPGCTQKDERSSRSSPLRRSGTVDEFGASRSSSSEKLERSSSSLDKEKNEKATNGRKLTIEQSMGDKPEVQGGRIMKRKMRLDARSYRASFKPLAKKNMNSDAGGICQNETAEDGDRIEVFSSTRDDLGTSGLVESTSGRSAVHLDVESSGQDTVCKRVKMTAHIDSDNSATLLDSAVIIQNASTPDYTSSCPYLSRNITIEECSARYNLHRVLHDSEDQMLSVCSGGAEHSSAISPSKSSRCPEVGNSIGIAEEHIDSTQLKESIKEPLVASQNESGHNVCVICKLPGFLLCCNGKSCKRSYHLSCLDPPLKDVPPGVWHCLSCIYKKIKSGVYSVSEGIESIWDSQEEVQKEKLYLVKYKGLAHVHNRWVPETLMLLEAPILLEKFNKDQTEKVIWRKEWTEPQRLLLKRFLMPPSHTEEHLFGSVNDFPNCYHEWLVKWKGLDYEHASWELESSPFLCSSEGTMLTKDYERHREEAKKASDPSRSEKALSVKRNLFCELSKFPVESPPGLYKGYLNSINKLREFWHKNQNAVLIDDQERMVKSVLFMLSLLPHACQPFLIVTSATSLTSWESTFIRLVPSINLVVYNGNKIHRNIIRNLEFYEEGGCILVQVLIADPDAIVEDLEALDCIGWEAIVVDEYPDMRLSAHFEQFRNLSSDFRLLLLSGPLKDDFVEYLNLLSFLEPSSQEALVNSFHSDSDDSTDVLALLKKRLACYTPYEHKLNSSKFLEYWVPVRLSDVQLEQYCSTLLSNSLSLCSQSNREQIGHLHDILISARKCCDHPYLVDGSSRSLLTKSLTRDKQLEFEVNASGKLQLLDQILQEIKNHKLRVLILFQSIDVARRISIGDILDDFLCERYGAYSYERVDKGMITSKKQTSLNMFNDKASTRFVLLIDTRACLPSVKISSVDTVIIFSSDWNPVNDLKALQKISIDSQVENVPVFRLYSFCTVEEKVLIFAKENMILESNIQNISSSVCHSLLGWGASYFFRKLDEFHKHDSQQQTSSNKSLVNMLELLTQIPKVDSTCTKKQSILVKVQQSGASYLGNIILAGEKKSFAPLDNEPSTFWSKLLERDSPQWRYISGSSQSTRRKFEILHEAEKEIDVESDGNRKKRSKVASNTAGPMSAQCSIQGRSREAMGARFFEDTCSCCPGSVLNDVSHDMTVHSLSKSTFEAFNRHTDEPEGGENIRTAQAELYSSLKHDLLKLCDALRFPKNVKHTAEMLLKYIMENHRIPSEIEKTILQALIVSLCWQAASCLKYMLDREESLAIANRYLNFNCKWQAADSIYAKLQILKGKCSHQSGASLNSFRPNIFANHSSVPRKYASEVPMLEGSLKTSSQHQVLDEGKVIEYPTCMFTEDLTEDGIISSHEVEEGEIVESPVAHRSSEQSIFIDQELEPPLEIGQGLVTPVAPDLEVNDCNGLLGDKPLNLQIDMIDKIYAKRLEKLLLKQKLEVDNFKVKEHKEWMKLRKSHDLDLDLIRTVNADRAARNLDVKLLDNDFSRKKIEFDQHMKRERRKLAVLHINARNKEKQMKHRWLEDAKAGKLVESFENLPLLDFGFGVEKLFRRQSRVLDGSVNTSPLSASSSDENLHIIAAAKQGESTETEVSAEIVAAVPISGADMSMEIETPAPEASNAAVNVSAELCTLVVTPGSVASGRPLQTENPAPIMKIIVSVENEHEGINIGSLTTAITVTEQHGAAHSNGACLKSPLQSQTKFNHSAIESGRPRCEKSASCNQVVHACEQEMPAVLDRLGRSQAFTSPQPTVPTAHYVDRESSRVEPTDHDQTLHSPSLLQLPPSICHGHEPVRVGAEQEPINQEEPISESILHSVPSLVNTQTERSGSRCLGGTDVTPVMRCHFPNTSTMLQHMPINQEEPISESILHSVPSLVNTQTERSGSRCLGGTDVTPEMRYHFPNTSTMLQHMPTQELHPSPLQIELMRLHKQRDLFTQLYEQKKLQLKSEYEIEVEKVRRKFDTLIQEAATEFIQKKQNIERISSKIIMNITLAKEFRANFMESNGWSAMAQGSSVQQIQALASRAASAPQIMAFDSRYHPVFPSNLASRPSSILRVGSGPQLAAPAPHLQHLMRSRGPTSNLPNW